MLRGIDLERRRRTRSSRCSARTAWANRRSIARISGVFGARAGAIRFDGVAIEREKPAMIVARGLIHVPEGRRIFPNLTVRENLDLGSYRRAPGAARTTASASSRIFPRLRERHVAAAGTLSGGEQQMLAIGRGLMADPKLLILGRAVARPVAACWSRSCSPSSGASTPTASPSCSSSRTSCRASRSQTAPTSSPTAAS